MHGWLLIFYLLSVCLSVCILPILMYGILLYWTWDFSKRFIAFRHNYSYFFSLVNFEYLSASFYYCFLPEFCGDGMSPLPSVKCRWTNECVNFWHNECWEYRWNECQVYQNECWILTQWTLNFDLTRCCIFPQCRFLFQMNVEIVAMNADF